MFDDNNYGHCEITQQSNSKHKRRKENCGGGWTKIAEAVDGKKGISSGDDHRGQQRE